jgi:hypothetical protein
MRSPGALNRSGLFYWFRVSKRELRLIDYLLDEASINGGAVYLERNWGLTIPSSTAPLISCFALRAKCLRSAILSGPLL